MNDAKGFFKCLTLPAVKVELTLTFINGTSGGWDSVEELCPVGRQSEEWRSKGY